LASGILNGMVGDEREYRGYKNVYCGKYIKDGKPVSYRQGQSERFFNGRENENISGKRKEEHFDTDEKKLEFLQRYGWLIDDEDVRSYSAEFKSKK
jgi:hypothetical protein